MFQERLFFLNYDLMSAPGHISKQVAALKRGIFQPLRSAQFQVGLAAVASLLVLAVIAVRPDSSYPTMQLLLTYNAIILGYLSAFWGLWTEALPEDAGGLPFSSRRIALAERERLLWSLAPTVLGGCGMLLPLFLPQDIGVLMLIIGFTLLVTLEALGQRRGVPPADYKRLRWTVSLTAMVILLDVLMNQRWAVRVFF